MDATLTQQPTTADAILERAHLVGQAVAYLIRSDWTTLARATKGAELLEHGHVRETAELGTYRVRSARDPQTAYTVRSDQSCTCPDQQNRGGHCCHQAAIFIGQLVEQELGHRALNRAAAAPVWPQTSTRQPCASAARAA